MISNFIVDRIDVKKLSGLDVAVLDYEVIFSMFIKYIDSKVGLCYKDVHKKIWCLCMCDLIDGVVRNLDGEISYFYNIYREFIIMFCKENGKKFNELLVYPFTKEFHEYLLETDYFKNIRNKERKIIRTFHNYFTVHERSGDIVFDYNKESKRLMFCDMIYFREQFIEDFDIKKVVYVKNVSECKNILRIGMNMKQVMKIKSLEDDEVISRLLARVT